MKKSHLVLDYDSFVILDFVLGIAYVFFVNFYSHVTHSGLLDSVLSIILSFTTALYLCIVVYTLFTNKKKQTFLLVYISCYVTVYLINIAFFPNNREVFEENAKYFILTIFRLSSLLFLIDDYKRLMKWLANYSLLISLFLLSQFFFNGLVFNNGVYSMALGYISLFPTVILISVFFSEKHLIYLFGGIINALIILIYASRGPLLCLALFVAFSLLKNSKPYVILLAILSIVLVYVFFDDILKLIIQIIPNGQSSRTLMYLVQNNVADDSGRGEMYQRLLFEIRNKPFGVRGINADYKLFGVYSHNIILELIYEFGVVFGIIILIDLVAKILVTYIHSNNDKIWQLSFVFMTIAVPELLVSNTLWREWTFWAWLVLFYKCEGHRILYSLLNGRSPKLYGKNNA